MATTTYTITERPKKGSIDQKGVRRYSRTFSVRSTTDDESAPMLDSPSNVVNAVLLYLGIDLYYPYNDGLVTDANALLKNASAEQTDDFIDWNVSLNWDSEANAVDRGSTGAISDRSPGAGAQSVAANLRPPVIKLGSADKERILDYDYSWQDRAGTLTELGGTIFHEDDPGTPVVNSAGCPFDPPVTLPVSYTTISITFFSLRPDYAAIARYKNSVNDADWEWAGLQIPKDFARCTEYTQTSTYENGRWYWEHQIVIEVSPDLPYNPVKILDAGTMAKPATTSLKDAANTTKLVPITSVHNGQPVTQPVPLDGEGQPLAAGEDPIYLEFQGYRREPFDLLVPSI